MAGNTYINDRLIQWAKWSLQRDSGGLGYPRQCAFMRMASDHNFGSRIAPDVNELAWEIEQAVRVLPDVLREAVVAFYLGKGTMEQRCRDCHCSRVTLYRRVDDAQCRVMDWLNGYYCKLDEYNEVVRHLAETKKVLQDA